MNSREIQKLRKKFIFVSMLSLFIAMLFIGGMIFGNSTFVIRNNI